MGLGSSTESIGFVIDLSYHRKFIHLMEKSAAKYGF
jgi:hypothetical protein